MARDYARLLRQLLPKGAIWESAGNGLLSILDGLAFELGRVDGRAGDLELEMMPGTATELLSVWEAALGLPDDGCELAGTITERQTAAQARFASRGRDWGAGAVFLRKVAAQLGYTLAITRLRRPTNSESAANAAVDTEASVLVWQLEASSVSEDLDSQLRCSLSHVAINDFELSMPFAPLEAYAYARAAGMSQEDIITGAVTTAAQDVPGYSWVLGV